MRKTFITGGSGFIGYHFHRFMDQRSIVNFDLVAPDFEAESLYVEGNVCQPESIDAALTANPCDAIICLAAEHKDFGIEEEAYFKTNEYGTRCICDAASRHGIREIVYFSSVAVYQCTQTPSTEESTLSPSSPYGMSKLAAEEVIRHWVREDSARTAIVIRPTVVFGAQNLANMLRLIIQIDKGRYVNIGRGDNIKSIAFVDNLVKATLLLMDRKQPGFELFNYSDQPQLSVREIAGVIADALGKRHPITLPYSVAYTMGLPFDVAIHLTGLDLPISTKRIKRLRMTTHHKADKLFRSGFKPDWTSVNGLRQMVAWYLEEKQRGCAPVVATDSGR